MEEDERSLLDTDDLFDPGMYLLDWMEVDTPTQKLPMKLDLMVYNELAKWLRPQIIRSRHERGYEGVKIGFKDPSWCPVHLSGHPISVSGWKCPTSHDGSHPNTPEKETLRMSWKKLLKTDSNKRAWVQRSMCTWMLTKVKKNVNKHGEAHIRTLRYIKTRLLR